MNVRLLVVLVLAGAISSSVAPPQPLVGQEIKGNTRLYRELDDVELKGPWYFEDLAGARREAERTGRPLLVVLRCPP